MIDNSVRSTWTSPVLTELPVDLDAVANSKNPGTDGTGSATNKKAPTS